MAESPTKRSAARRWKFRLGVVLVFLLGVVIGGVGTGLFIFHGIDRVLHADTAGFTARAMAHLDDDLDLTPAQRAAIEPEVARASTRLADLRRQVLDDVRRIVDESAARVSAHLRPDQQRRLEQHLQHAMERWQRERN